MARRLGMLSLANLNPCVKEMQYAVRGPIVIKAAELEGQLNKVGRGGGTTKQGAYTNSVGIASVLDHVAEYISQRDGYPASPADIFLGTGASGCIKC
eukprot:sb/3479031/